MRNAETSTPLLLGPSMTFAPWHAASRRRSKLAGRRSPISGNLDDILFHEDHVHLRVSPLVEPRQLLGHNRQRQVVAVAAFVIHLVSVAVGGEHRAVGKVAECSCDWCR